MNDRELSALLAAMPTADEACELLALSRELLTQRAVFGGTQPSTWSALSTLVEAIDERTEKP